MRRERASRQPLSSPGRRVILAALLAALPMSALAVPRDRALENAAAFATHPWYCAADNLTVECSDDWESDYSVGSYAGLPYMWGGWDSLETFDQKLEEGYGAGSHSWHGILSCVTGQDCSGFVTRCWESTTRYTTSSFYQVTTEIDVEEVRAADAFNDPGNHIVLHAYFRDDGVPAFYEAAGGPSKVRFTAASSWSYLNGYTPIRYNGIEEATPPAEAGNVDDPIDITTFPFHDARNTVLSSSDIYDEYPCKPGTYERGPEYLYALDLPRGQLTVEVSDPATVDIDLHLLAGLQESTCLARDDVGFTYAIVEPGRYYLIADSWSSSSSLEEYPGPFELVVDFLPDPDGGGGDGGDPGADCGASLTGAAPTAGAIGSPSILILAVVASIRRRRNG